MKRIILAMTLWLFCSSAFAFDIDEVTKQLTSNSFEEKQQAIKNLTNQDDKLAQSIVSALVSGHLYWYKKENIFTIKDDNQFISLTSNKSIHDKKSQFKRVAINNGIRQSLEQYLLQVNLAKPAMSTRRDAAKTLFGKINTPELNAFVINRLAVEKDNRVKNAIIDALAFNKLDNDNEEIRILALSYLSNIRNSPFEQKLHQLIQSDGSGLIKQKSQELLNGLEREKSFYNVLEQIYFGLSLGSILVLAAIGLAITFGVMGVINMAHGELIMIGAYTTDVMQGILPNSPGVALLLSIPVAFIVAGLFGIVIEHGVIRFLYGRPLETLLATFGISLLLQQLARTIFSPLNKAIIAPSWMQGSYYINDFFSLTINRLYIIAFCLIVFFTLFFIMKKSTLGLNVRAISMNPMMARSLGVKASWVNALTFGLGSGIAGLAGVALSQITNVGPNLGQSYIIDSFMVVVFGGVGNLWGTLIAGSILGLMNKFIEPLTGAMLAKIVILVGLVLFIQKCPRGLFPQKGRSVEG